MYLVTPDNKNFLRVHDRETANRLADEIRGTISTPMKPEYIVIDDKTGHHIAVFDEVIGLTYAKSCRMLQTTDYTKMHSGQFYVKSFSNILLRIDENDFPEFQRSKVHHYEEHNN